MTLPQRPNQPFPLTTALLALAAATLGLVGVAQVLLLTLGWNGQTVPCVLAAALCGGASLLAMIPVALLARSRGAEGVALGFLAGILVRMLICGVGVLVLRAHAGQSIGYWVGAWYMVELLIEVTLIGRYLTRLPRPTPKDPMAKQPHGNPGTA